MITYLTISRWLGNCLVLELFYLEDAGKSVASNAEVENEDVEYEETGVWVQSKGEADE